MTTNQKFLGRAPKHHHPKAKDIVQQSLYVLDQAVDAHVGGQIKTLPAGTLLSVTAGGCGPTGRQSWMGKLMTGGEEVIIPIE